MLAGVLLVTALSYARSLGNGFVFDDWLFVGNRYVGQWSFFWKSLTRDPWWFRDPARLPQTPYYRPLQDVWIGLNYQLFGAHPAGWHAAMVALHLLVVFLVFKISEVITRERAAALLAALLFGVLPMHAAAVAFASAADVSLVAALELGAFYLVIRRARGPGSIGSPHWDSMRSRCLRTRVRLPFPRWSRVTFCFLSGKTAGRHPFAPCRSGRRWPALYPSRSN